MVWNRTGSGPWTLVFLTGGTMILYNEYRLTVNGLLLSIPALIADGVSHLVQIRTPGPGKQTTNETGVEAPLGMGVALVSTLTFGLLFENTIAAVDDVMWSSSLLWLALATSTLSCGLALKTGSSVIAFGPPAGDDQDVTFRRTRLLATTTMAGVVIAVWMHFGTSAVASPLQIAGSLLCMGCLCDLQALKSLNPVMPRCLRAILPPTSLQPGETVLDTEASKEDVLVAYREDDGQDPDEREQTKSRYDIFRGLSTQLPLLCLRLVAALTWIYIHYTVMERSIDQHSEQREGCFCA
ncbi:hypothetical protein M8818_006194 [Zalaria obscura]|uniref:Uncharacterized protein n=1 Tax=Zalaria obscura TaxID=2024903 RepID=A0ACC3SBJ7_9PEZI